LKHHVETFFFEPYSIDGYAASANI
jgi:hypothetical protein